MFANMMVGQLHRILLTELQKLFSANEAGIIADWVFEKRMNFSKGDIIKKTKELVKDCDENKIREDLHRLLLHEPVQYVLEEAWFYKMKLKVNKHVLVPRPETEELVQLILKELSGNQSLSIIDIGTGSGCIAIAIKKQLPDASVTAIDISDQALTVASENALLQNVLINFKRINFLDENEWDSLQQFNVIVSNPPYIPLYEKEKLDKNVADYEPGTALFVPDHDPILFYKKITGFAKYHLTEKGKIFVEVHENFAKEVFDLFSTTYTHVKIEKDIYGKDRMVIATQFL